MQIGELFVNLGIKGADKAVGALTDVGKGMKETASLSLEAKAGILGAMYALEQFVQKSGSVGTNLTNFTAVTGKSAQILQQYQYAARQVGVSNEETAATFKNLQKSMTDVFLGKGAPSGFAQLQRMTGNISRQDVEKFMANPELLLQRLQTYASREKNVGVRNATLSSFGLGDNISAAVDRNAFNQQALSKAPTYSDQEIGKLNDANIAWSNLNNKIEMAIGHFNALHGGELAADFTKIIDRVITLTEAFVKLADKLKLFQGIGKSLEGLTAIFDGVGSAVDRINKASGNEKEQEKLKGEVGSFFAELPGVFNEISKDIFGEKGIAPQSLVPQDVILPIAADSKKPGTADKPVVVESKKQAEGTRGPISTSRSEVSKELKIVPGRDIKTVLPGKEIRTNTEKSTLAKVVPLHPSAVTPSRLAVPTSPAVHPGEITPKLPATASANAATNQNISVNQNLNFQHEGKNAKQTGDSVEKAVMEAFRQLPSQVQGT